MTAELKSIIHFVAGGPTTLPHGLREANHDSLVPDHIELSMLEPGLTVTADDTNVTISFSTDVDVLTESWHSIERAFGAPQIKHLTPQPFVLGQGGSPSELPFKVQIITIYARTTGNDTSGNGSIAKPYRTFQRAIRNVPSTIQAGTSYVVDITNLGIESLPADYQLPSIQGTYMSGTSAGPTPTPNNDPFLFNHPLMIRAYPQLVAAIPAPQAKITATSGFTRGIGPDASLVEIKVPGVRTSWAGGALKGKQLIRTGGGGTDVHHTTCVIYDSIANDGFGNAVLRICNRISNIPDAPTLGTAEYQIVEPSVTFECPPPDNFDFCYFDCANVSGLAFQGIRIVGTSPGSGAALQIVGAAQPFIELCDFQDGIVVTGATYQLALFSTWIGPGGIISTGSCFTGRRSFIQGAGYMAFDGFYNEFFLCVLEGCAPIGAAQWPSGQVTMDMGFVNSMIDGTGGYGSGINMVGGKLNVSDATIKNCSDNAILLERGCNYALIDALDGTGNGSYGILANDGAQVQITDATTTSVVGASGAVKSGNLPVAAYAPGMSQYDITAVGAGGAVGTGTRIFERA